MRSVRNDRRYGFSQEVWNSATHVWPPEAKSKGAPSIPAISVESTPQSASMASSSTGRLTAPSARSTSISAAPVTSGRPSSVGQPEHSRRS